MVDSKKLYDHLVECREICKTEDQRNSAQIYHSIIKKIDAGDFECGCPMTKDVPLTVQQQMRFCALGCSVNCGEFLKRYIAAIAKVKKEKDQERVYNRKGRRRMCDES